MPSLILLDHMISLNHMQKNLIVSIIILVVAVLGLYFVSRGGVKKDNMPAGQNQVTGLQITTLSEGTGIAAKSGDTVSVNYTGTFEDGAAFDSNVDPKFGHVAPYQFILGQGMVILGWDEGVAGMKVGEKRKLVIPSDLAYGDQGIPGSIPAKATLTFDVELLKIGK